MDATTAVRPLTIWLFGRPRCRTVDGEGAFPLRPGARALFVALAFAGRPLRRDWLAAALWPDVTNAVARTNLRRHVAYVEAWLKALTACDMPIARPVGMLGLDPSIVEWVDVRAFEDAIAGGALDEAIAMYAGDLLADFDDEWIAVERRRVRARYDEAVAALVASAQSRNETEAALRYARTARAVDPYNEAWLRTTMRVRYGAGDRAGALHEFESYRTLVADELDLEPMPETVMLADSMRRIETQTSPMPRPFESTTFVGRARERRQLAERLHRERLVTVCGQPGVGKSRLALRCARELAPRDGVIIVDAAAAGDVRGLERAVLQALRSDTADAPAESIEELNPTLDAVVVLDGCERAAPPCADIVRRLLQTSGQVQIIASSRVPLGVTNESVFELGPLPITEATQLFLERFRTARSRVHVPDADLPVVERICRAIDGLPLAVELAAARARTSTLAQVEREIHRFAGRPGSGLLAAAFDSSYALLASTERAVLRRLAAFAGDWSIGLAVAACAEIAAEKEILGACATLVEQSLIVPPGLGEIGARYSMLDAAREFARSRSRALGETEYDARAHARAVARHYADIGRRLRGERATEYYPEVERDRENIEAALATLWRGADRDRDLAGDLSLAVSRFWADQGFAREGERHLRKALDHVGTGDRTKRLELLRVIGTLTRNLGDYAASYDDLRELVRLLEAERSTPVEIAKAQTMAANAARMMGDFAGALERTQIAHTVFVENGEAYLAAWATYALGTTRLSAGHFARAAVDLQAATDQFNDLGAVSDSSSSIANLGLCHFYQGRLEIAHELTRESLARARSVGHRYYVAHALLNEALIVNALGDGITARNRISEAGAIGKALGAHDVAISCAEAACAVVAASQPDVASILLGSADNARERFHAPRFPVDLPSYVAVCTTLRQTLGDDRFEALRARGRVTPLRAAIARLTDFDEAAASVPLT